MDPSNIIPVILCGGAGTRLWPLSTEARPKQFLPLAGTHSTFQQALLRVAAPELFAPPLVIANAQFRFVVAEQVRASGSPARIVLEPARRDSCLAVAVAAELIHRTNPAAIVLVLASDHAIGDNEAFRAACRAALPAAAAGRIVTFGVPPRYAAVDFGYLRPGAAVSGAVRAVDRFAEKPDAETAARYCADGHLWNSGNFLFAAQTMRAEIARFEPAIAEAARTAVGTAEADSDFLRLPAAPYESVPAKSIDLAVLERTERAAVIPCDCGWFDLGTWTALREWLPRDPHGNGLHGRVHAVDSRNNVIYSDGRLVTVVGLDNCIVAATADAVLIAPHDRADEIRTLEKASRPADCPTAPVPKEPSAPQT